MEALYKRAWGREWDNTSKITVQAALSADPHAPPIAEDVADGVVHIAAYVEPGVSLNQEFVCYHGLWSVAATLGLVIDPEDDVLVVRAEYINLVARLTTGDLQKFSRFVFTGHPGIGKTMFLIYVLLRRLENRKPTAFQLSPSQYVIFDEQGAVVVTQNMQSDRTRLNGCWALADSNNVISEPCQDFLTSKARVIQTTSPNPERWASWKKHAGAVLIIMDLPSALDVAAVATAQNFELSAALAHMGRYGPSLRTIFRLLRKVTTEFEVLRAVNTQARKLCSDDPAFLHSPSAKTRPSAGDMRDVESNYSQLLFLRPLRTRYAVDQPRAETDLLIRMDGSESIVERRGVPSYIIPTPHHRAVYENHRTSLDVALSLSLFEALSTHSLTKTSAAWLLQIMMHRWMCSGGTPLEIKSNAAIQAVRALERNAFYWIPSDANFAGIDSVLFTGKNLYALQATVGATHTPKAGLKKLWENMNPASRQRFRWHIVFIIRENAADNLLKFQRAGIILGSGKGKVTVKACVCMFGECGFGESADGGEEDRDEGEDEGMIDDVDNEPVGG
ncbi:hypothetical protein PENSPDRAFT_687664 [Peniophora sp. CONT]|nr:hypothetical protein PENSPDRAFT_687664 [Peniophora sp. CONT]